MSSMTTIPVRIEVETIKDLIWMQQNTPSIEGKRLPTYSKLIAIAVKKERRKMESK